MRVYQRTWHRGRKVFKVWTFTLQVNGKQVRRSNLKWSRRDAQEAGAKYVLDHNLMSDARRKTFREVVRRYLDYKRGEGKRSIREDEAHLRRLAQALGPGTMLTDITAEAIAEYRSGRIAGVSRRGRPLSSASVNRELQTLRHLLRLAEEWGYIEKVPKIRLAKEPDGRLRFLTEEEITRLLEGCERSKNPYLKTIVIIAINTGMRRGEIVGLVWERVDLARGVILLIHTKNGRRREVPMNQAVYDALSALPGPREGFVFRKDNGAAWGNIRTAFEHACREARIEDLTFHDLRHTFASHLVMRGRSLKEVQELLGHRMFSMTLRYAHLAPDRLRDAVTSLENLSTQVSTQPEGDVVTAR